MNADLHFSLSGIKTSLGNFFHRFHFILFFIFSVGGLAAGILLLYNVVEMSDQANGYTSSGNSTQFDSQTIERLRGLKSADQATDKLELNGRINPFSE